MDSSRRARLKTISGVFLYAIALTLSFALTPMMALTCPSYQYCRDCLGEHSWAFSAMSCKSVAQSHSVGIRIYVQDNAMERGLVILGRITTVALITEEHRQRGRFKLRSVRNAPFTFRVTGCAPEIILPLQKDCIPQGVSPFTAGQRLQCNRGGGRKRKLRR